MGFDNILFYNMTINSLYNPKTFFYKKLNLDNIFYYLNFNQLIKTTKLYYKLKKKLKQKNN